MNAPMLILIIIAALVVFIAPGFYIVYRCVYTVPGKAENQVSLYYGEQFQKRKNRIFAMILQAKDIPYKDVYTKGADGRNLHACYYEAADPKAPFLLMFHGYRSGPLRDFPYWISDGVARGYNILAVDQRGHRESDGRCVTLGVKERLDVLPWVEFIGKGFGEDRKITVMGGSMGATTVLMAADSDFPDSVTGIVADGAYTSAGAILRKCSRDHRVPLWFAVPMLTVSARLFAGFGLENVSAPKALSRTKVPVLLIHGEKDAFVPFAMAKENFRACSSEKELYCVPGAGHGLCYLSDPEKYRETLGGFLNRTNPV